MLFLFLEIIFLFFDLDCQNLATLGFDNCPISEKENYLLEKKVRIRVFPPLCNLFPATRNIYSKVGIWSYFAYYHTEFKWFIWTFLKSSGPFVSLEPPLIAALI